MCTLNREVQVIKVSNAVITDALIHWHGDIDNQLGYHTSGQLVATTYAVINL